jgi:Ca2+-binding RTX toxin-like protein
MQLKSTARPAARNKSCITGHAALQQATGNGKQLPMPTYKYGVPPFTTTTFTSPVAGTKDAISANVLADFTINGNGGDDTVSTGGGNDTITTTAGNDNITAGSGNNTVSAGDGTNNVTSGSGNDTITTGAGADTVTSGTGDDIITTGGGDDRIQAGGGDDTINAGAGNDRITAGGGTDSIIGGGGHDIFVYDGLADAMLGADTISDFGTSNPNVAGEGDTLLISRLILDFTGAGRHASLAKLVASGHISFSGDSENTVISFDSNGNTAGGSVGTLVTLVAVPFTTEGDAVIALSDNIIT